jgi:hypothetical protein
LWIWQIGWFILTPSTARLNRSHEGVHIFNRSPDSETAPDERDSRAVRIEIFPTTNSEPFSKLSDENWSERCGNDWSDVRSSATLVKLEFVVSANEIDEFWSGFIQWSREWGGISDGISTGRGIVTSPEANRECNLKFVITFSVLDKFDQKEKLLVG